MADNLSLGETLRILRRRAGLTQAQEAEARSLPLTAYKDIEDDEPTPWQITGVRKLKLSQLSDAEKCFIYRRRADMTLDDLARQSGFSKFTLCKMEKGSAPIASLLAWWEA